MPEFDRFDICEANWIHACDWGEYGIIKRLLDIPFKASPFLNSYDDLTENGQNIYDALQPTGAWDRKRPGAQRG